MKAFIIVLMFLCVSLVACQNFDAKSAVSESVTIAGAVCRLLKGIDNQYLQFACKIVDAGSGAITPQGTVKPGVTTAPSETEIVVIVPASQLDDFKKKNHVTE